MAKLCVEGLHSTYAYCDKHAIPYDKCGKLVVAHSELEIKRLEAEYNLRTVVSSWLYSVPVYKKWLIRNGIDIFSN